LRTAICFMSSVTAPDWNHSSVMPPSMQIDGIPAAMAVKLAWLCSMPVEASSTLKSDFIMASHTAEGGS
jgi:hypothetical protein